MERHSRCSRWLLPVLLCTWLAAGASPGLQAQMSSVVNSLADDADAYPYDNPDTEDIDESIDGICEDAAGRCTLRAALDEAAYIGTTANVTFDPSLNGLIVIRGPAEPFSVPSGSKVLGYEQSVHIVGNGAYSFLMVLDSNSTVQGLGFSDATEAIDVGGKGNLIGGDSPALRNIFTNISQAAINLIGDDNKVQGNFIGLTAFNTVSGNTFGVLVTNSSRNLIGGTGPGEGNVISGNTNAGVALVGDSTETGLTFGGNVVYGNFIGTDSSGTEARPNQYGISVTFGHAITIGGPNLGERNVISGNSVAGIALGPNSDTVRILGNTIGADVTGVFGVPNRTGVILGPGSSNCIVENNLISSNLWEGVSITGYAGAGLPSVRHRVSGNTIVLNGVNGVSMTGDATHNIIGSSLTQNFAPNEIQYNGQGSASQAAGGVVIAAPVGGTPRANTIRKNDFLDNAPDGIVIEQTAGIQDGIQPPAITIYTVYGDGTALVNGTHHRPGSRIDIYSAGKTVGPTYQGRGFWGSGTVDANGDFAVSMDSCVCSRLIATATDAAGNTSAFSLPFQTLPNIVTADLSLNSGWNMVSVPVAVADFSTSALFSGSTVGAYSYSGGSYMPMTTLGTGVGYWVRYPGPATVSLQGSAVASETVAVATGWNLVGSITPGIAASSIVSVPGGLATTGFYEYNLAYELADTIRPGRAYWVKVNNSGSLILSSSGHNQPANRIRIIPGGELPPPPPGADAAATTAPAGYRLEQNFPNPFNPVTEIRYQLPEGGQVSLKIYDLLGRQVATLVDGYEPAGTRSASWDASGAGSGAYLYELIAGTFRARGLMQLVR